MLQNGQVLLAGGSISGPYGGPSAELFNPNTAWKATGDLNVPRNSGSTITLLTNGEVLVAGGNASGVESSNELYNPSNGTWTLAGIMNEPRQFHTATLLSDGKVLVAGGVNNDDGTLSSAELYDPVTGLWTSTGSMSTGRSRHTATLLKNGKVLVTGGRDVNNQTLTSSELYDPTTGTWSATAATQYPTAATILLTNGELLAIENHGDGYCELYNPSAGIWTMTGTSLFSFTQPNVTLLANGKVFGFANYNPGTETYDPGTGLWTATAPETNFLFNTSVSTATTLSDGRVLVVRGGGFSDAALYDPTTDRWTNTFGPMTSLRSDPLAVLLPDGRVLVAGGDISLHLGGNAAELFDPNVGTTPSLVLVPSSTFTGGAFQFSFAATPGQTFTVWSATNMSIAFTNWMSLGPVAETSPGHYQFSDAQATNLLRRFYRVTSP
ncbi:MAG TPA: kelch repeat-containing protein [Verrucomicrobiae bacterium]|nr:kelch repeat-containing protein [Verrucomicrobiae bacterium]